MMVSIICFNPIYYPWEQWLASQSFISTELKLINHTWWADLHLQVPFTHLKHFIKPAISKAWTCLGEG
jgi:hypothetical protein